MEAVLPSTAEADRCNENRDGIGPNTCNIGDFKTPEPGLLPISRLGNRNGPNRGRLAVSRPYPANLCPLSCGVEFAGFAEDFGQAVGEPI